MTENKDKKDKSEKKLAPPRTNDPNLSEVVELGERITDKKGIIFGIEREIMPNQSSKPSEQPKPESTVPPRQNDPYLGATEQKDGKPSGETRHK